MDQDHRDIEDHIRTIIDGIKLQPNDPQYQLALAATHLLSSLLIDIRRIAIAIEQATQNAQQ